MEPPPRGWQTGHIKHITDFEWFEVSMVYADIPSRDGRIYPQDAE